MSCLQHHGACSLSFSSPSLTHQGELCIFILSHSGGYEIDIAPCLSERKSLVASLFTGAFLKSKPSFIPNPEVPGFLSTNESNHLHLSFSDVVTHWIFASLLAEIQQHVSVWCSPYSCSTLHLPVVSIGTKTLPILCINFGLSSSPKEGRASAHLCWACLKQDPGPGPRGHRWWEGLASRTGLIPEPWV